MTATATNTKDKNKNPAPVTSAAPIAEDDDFVDFVIDRPAFKPEVLTERSTDDVNKEIYVGPAVTGYVVANAKLGEALDKQTGELRDVYAYIFKLSKPAKVTNREGKMFDAQPGDEIYVWENAQLLQAIPREVANCPTHVLHTSIYRSGTFRGPNPSDKTQRMWSIKVANAKVNPVPRSQIQSGASVIAQMQMISQGRPVAGLLDDGKKLVG